MAHDTPRSDNFAWVDDLVKRWPVIVVVFGMGAWMTRMQWVQDAQAASLKSVPGMIEQVNNMNIKLEAVLEEMGYEVKYVAVKKEVGAQTRAVEHGEAIIVKQKTEEVK